MTNATDFTATYSVEDDKIRIYFNHYLDKDFYDRFIDLGFRKAPIQGCHFAVWSPSREDFAIELAEEIYADGTTFAERAQAKAERCDTYAANNKNKANAFHTAASAIAERFNTNQVILTGHHSERKSTLLEKRLNSAKGSALHHARMVSYWIGKATGAERHANQKSDSAVRARRIKTLLAELRREQRIINEAYRRINLWETKAGKYQNNPEIFKERVTVVAGLYGMALNYKGESCFFLLKEDRIDPKLAYDHCLAYQYSIVEKESHYRVINHLLNRLSYERSMQGNIPVFEGHLTPVMLQAFLREHGTESPEVVKEDNLFIAKSSVPFPVHIANNITDSLSLTDGEWRELMFASGYEIVQKTKTAKQAAPLLNIKAGSIQTRLHNGKTLNCREMTKAEFEKIYHEHRGTALADTLEFRVRIALIARPGEPYSGEWFYIYLTGSKTHATPQNQSQTAEQSA